MPERCFLLTPMPATLTTGTKESGYTTSPTTIPAGTPCVQIGLQHHEVNQDTVIGVNALDGSPVVSRQIQLIDSYRLMDPVTKAVAEWVTGGAFERREVPEDHDA